jgi:1-deoxy-D-xylulose-5-phosphate reductoisomerase
MGPMDFQAGAGARRIAVLGCTGSIGRDALDLAARHPDRLRVVALACHRDVDGLLAAAARFRPEAVAAADPSAAATLAARLEGSGIRVVGLLDAAAWPSADATLVAISGVAGLRPAMAAAAAGKRLALANKESLVAAGAALLRRARQAGAEVLPVDSEHAGLFAALQGVRRGSLRRLWLTASGGPLRGRSAEEVASATPEVALRHPTWPSMGRRITVDSATLLNKGLEVIEAHHLFDVGAEAIGVVVHPQSVVHAMVELTDGSLLMQASRSDMRLPIAFALAYPERWAPPEPAIPPTGLPDLQFEEPDRRAFPCLDLAYAALRAGGTAPAVLNAADEVAVARFLAGEFPLGQIPRLLEAVLGQHRGGAEEPELGEALAADAWARERAAAWRPALAVRGVGR